MRTRRWVLGALAAALLTAAAEARAQDAKAEGPLVFAAASLKDAFDAIGAEWAAETGRPAPRFSYAASSTLAKQIEQGAPADLFASADQEWMDYLATRNLVRADTRRNLVENALVLIKPVDSPASFDIRPGADLAAALGPDGRLATGETASVPVGKYAKQALTSLGMWDGVRDRLAQTDSVRSALALVARGEAPLGVVYLTDAKVEPKVAVVARFPADSHAPIVYPAAQAAASSAPDAAAFLARLSSPAAAAVYQRFGFSVAPSKN